MSNLNQHAHVLGHLVARDVFRTDPFVLIDVGYALGIEPTWRLFGEYLVAHGFDAQVDECARLRSFEEHPNVTYHATFVGLPEGHPFHSTRRAADDATREYFDPFSRTSTWSALHHDKDVARDDSTAMLATARWPEQTLVLERTTLSDFFQREGVRSVDFVKIDTDGSDLEVAMSCEWPLCRPESSASSSRRLSSGPARRRTTPSTTSTATCEATGSPCSASL